MLWLLLSACNGQKGIEVDVTATVSDKVSSIVKLTWTNPEELQSYVRFGTKDHLDHQSPTSAAQSDASVLLLGMPPSTEVFYEVVNAADETVMASGSVSNGSLPGAFSDFDVVDHGGPGWDGYLVTSMMGSTMAPIIIDSAGNYVWWFEEPGDWVVSGARLSRDHQWVIYTNQPKSTVVDTGELVKVSIDGETVERWTLPGVHHDFVELPDGTITVFSQDTRTLDGQDAVGDRLLNIDADGNSTEVWNIFDDWPEADWSTSRETDTVNWSHGNAIDYDDASAAYRMSFRNFSAIIEVDAASRQTQWVLGGELSDYAITNDDQEQFRQEHQFEVLNTGVLVFDDGEAHRGWSRAVEYTFNGSDADLTWEYIPDPLVQSLVLGDVHRLDNGNTMVMFTTAGQLDVVDANAKLLWRLNGGLGVALGYCDPVSTLY